MREYKIAAIPGDGIGTEVIAAGLEVLQTVARDGGFKVKAEHFPWGSEYYLKHGYYIPEGGLDRLKTFDAIFFGAVGDQRVPDHVSLWGLRLPIAQGFDQYANVRPARVLPGVKSPLGRGSEIDWVVIRENSEGEYAGHGGRAHRGLPIEVGTETAVFTRAGVERIHRFAFELALVDAVTTRMVLKPQTLDVLVATNLHADILSDLAAALSGSLGIGPTANLNPERRFPSMFEPIHGSAFDIAGKGVANPIATFWTASMMLEHLGEPAASKRLMSGVESVTASGVRTRDLGGSANTEEVTRAVCAALER